MSNQRKEIDTGDALSSLDNMRALPCVNPYCHPDYVPPEPEEIEALFRLTGWSVREIAFLTGMIFVEKKKDCPAVRGWKAPKSSSFYRKIPGSAWQILLLYADLISMDQIHKSMRSALCPS